MESGKHLNSSSEESNFKKLDVKVISKCSSVERKHLEESSVKGGNSAKVRPRPSMIPVVKCERAEPKHVLHNQREYSSSKLSGISKSNKRKEEFENKEKLLEEKEKSIAEYYRKIDEMIKKFLTNKETATKQNKRKPAQNTAARKMTSDPLVFSNVFSKNILLEFEANIQQISDIWLKTSADLSNTLKNLKNNPPLDPVEFEIENVRIQLAIKQAKSLTLVKTRNVITEAKKIFRNREVLRNELGKLLSNDNLKLQLKKQQCKEEIKLAGSIESLDNQGMNGTGDSLNEFENQGNSKETTSSDDNGKKITEKATEERLGITLSEVANACLSSEEKDLNPEKTQSRKNCSDQVCKPTSETVSKMEMWITETAKKNEIITNLNRKIFELQKACNERSFKCSQLEAKLSEFYEKIQWNQVLWKQIGKLKQEIKGLQQNNKQLEFQKRELESKIMKLDQELDKLIKLNHLLNQKKYLLEAKEFTGSREEEKSNEELNGGDERIFAEKQNTINQLKTILGVMKDQETFAQKQVSMFQSKIEELKKNSKA